MLALQGCRDSESVRCSRALLDWAGPRPDPAALSRLWALVAFLNVQVRRVVADERFDMKQEQ